MSTILILMALFAFIPAGIAQHKGLNAGIWWFVGFILFPVALIAVLCEPSDHAAVIARKIRNEGMRACPHCAEAILPAAKVCRYCGRDVYAPTLQP